MGETNQLVAEGAVTVPEASEFSGIGRTVLYQKMGNGELRFVKIGNRRLIPRAELRRLLSESLVGAK